MRAFLRTVLNGLFPVKTRALIDEAGIYLPDEPNYGTDMGPLGSSIPVPLKEQDPEA